MLGHPVPRGQAADQPAVQTARTPIVDVFDRGIDLEPGGLQATGKRPIFFPVPLPIYQQGQTFLKTELEDFGIFHLLADRFGHARESHRMEFVQCGLH